ncbi:hypothetical protein Tco_0227786, partial [Tanacetum coccineum]
MEPRVRIQPGMMLIGCLCPYMLLEIIGLRVLCWEIDCKRLNTGSITVKSGRN